MDIYSRLENSTRGAPPTSQRPLEQRIALSLAHQLNTDRRTAAWMQGPSQTGILTGGIGRGRCLCLVRGVFRTWGGREEFFWGKRWKRGLAMLDVEAGRVQRKNSTPWQPDVDDEGSLSASLAENLGGWSGPLFSRSLIPTLPPLPPSLAWPARRHTPTTPTTTRKSDSTPRTSSPSRSFRAVPMPSTFALASSLYAYCRNGRLRLVGSRIR
ncbi:hypothetical protein IWZ01DRAFT_24641 [Phyllosticta capitalensis]|uniref:Uncharacterized protein n=1 Tax=Phyllosticta capitalensis TaxID=121624 RepID=A0ABR1Z3A4_9PEZI